MRLQRGDVSHIDRQTRVTLKGSASKLAASRREAAISGAPIPEQPVEKKTGSFTMEFCKRPLKIWDKPCHT